MKILVFSDTHLGKKFDEKKFNFLKKIINDCDKVIINGDLWEGFTCDFNTFIQSPWNQLFPILKQKKTVYVFGNHDRKEFSNEKTSLFSDVQTEKYLLKLNGHSIIFEHGNKITPFLDSKFGKKKPPQSIVKFLNNVEKIIVKGFGKLLLLIYYRRFNIKIKNKIKDKFNQNQILVCGHTHFQEVDTKNKFADSGFIKHGLGQYLIIEDGKINAFEEWYD